MRKILLLGLLLVGCAPTTDLNMGTPRYRDYKTYDQVWYTNRECFQSPASGCRVHPSSRRFYNPGF